MRKFALVFGLLTGCSTFNPRPTPVPGQPIEVRDVPTVARGAGESPRTRLLVLPFLEDRPNGRLGDLAEPSVTRDFARSGLAVIASPADVGLDPKKFVGPGNEYDLDRLARAVAPLGISAVIEGKVLEVTARKLGDTLGLIREARAQVNARVRLRVAGGKSGKEIFSDTNAAQTEASAMFVADAQGATTLRDDSDLTRQAIAEAFRGPTAGALRALEKLGWEGRVASIAGERVFINAGRLTGLQVGDILKVTEDGEDIFDPETGRFIGTAPGRLKGTVEVVSYFGKDGAIAVIHSGSGFRENDHVELY